MSKRISDSAEMDLAKVPAFYADQPAGLAMGPLVSKLTFGVLDDNGSDYPRPVVTVALPTVMLLELVEDLSQILGQKEFQESAARGLDRAKQKLCGGLKKATESRYTNLTKPASATKPKKKKVVKKTH